MGVSSRIRSSVSPETLRALNQGEIQEIVSDYRKTVENALEAGFEKIELHAANDHLLQQFLAYKTNQGNDQYAGSIENRARLLFEVLDVLTEVWPAERIGVRLASGSYRPLPAVGCYIWIVRVRPN